MPDRRPSPGAPRPERDDSSVSGEVRVEVEEGESISASGSTTTTSESFALQKGHIVGSYEIEGVIDVGGGGIVYFARHRVLGRRAALKTPREHIVSSPAMIARFVREAEAVARIRHPNIVDIYEFGEMEQGRPYYVMELLDGTDVRKLLKERGRFSPKETLDILDPVCRAVQASHQAGIVHRDIKASNVIIVEQDGERVVKLVDFGIAKPMLEASGQGLTDPGLLVGTAHNMAPEQIRGDRLDARTDVYGLGTLAFRMLTGHYPFDGRETMEIVMQQLHSPPPRPSKSAPVSLAVDAVVLRCLEKSPDRRFASAAEFLEAFRAAVQLPSAASEQSSWGVAVYFDVIADTESEMDDAMLEDMGNVLDTIEQGLSASGFVFPFHASNALLGVRLASMKDDADRAAKEAEANLAGWQAILAARPGRHPDVRVAASLCVGQALYRRVAGSVEIVGGELLDFAAWKDERRVLAS